jgi:leucyl aminopeptidase (aminopeptidase T)
MRMTDARMGNLRLILEKMCWVGPGVKLLVVADDYVRAMSLAHDFVDLANTMGADAVLAVFKRRTYIAEEPPATIAAAMKAADVVLEVTETSEIGHSTARKEATEAGLRRCILMRPEYGEDLLQEPITFEGLNAIKERTAKLAEIETRGKRVRVTTSHGTDLSFSIEGRAAISLSPLSDSPLVVAPTFGESAIAPVEGTTEGIIVVDSFVQGWRYMLRKPIRFEVKQGKALVETVFSEIPEQSERFKRLISMDKMANNCVAELGIGTSHMIPGDPVGYVIDKGRLGHIHVACGRNYDLGGKSDSIIHQDSDMTQATIRIDDVTIMENGYLKIE